MKNLYNTLNDTVNSSSKGALIASILAVFICMLYLTKDITSGFLPTFVDILLVVIVSVLLTASCFVAAYYCYRLVNKVNRLIVIALIGALLAVWLAPNEKINGFFIFFSIFIGVLIGLGVSKNLKRGIRLLLINVAVLISATVFMSLFSKGDKRIEPVTREYWLQKPLIQSKIVSAFGDKGDSIGHLFYGSGTDRHRREYSRDVTIKTQSVDGSAFFKSTSHIKHFLREAFWGFDIKKLPMDGRVWYPKSKGVFPLVIIVHGNHLMTEYSDQGYDYLGKQLAAQGFIVASIDENFLNESWYDDTWFKEMNVRAWLILKHLEIWRKWNATKGNPFEGRVDMKNICLIGHSRGADAAALAFGFNTSRRYPFDGNVLFDFNFSIKSLIQMAPTGRQTTEAAFPLFIRNVNYLLLQGSHDQDVYYCAGIKMYNRIQFDNSTNYKKSFLYIYRANHGQFNTNWGAMDQRSPNLYFLNSSALLSGTEQRQIAKTYISAFLRTTLKGQNEYLPILKDYRTAFGLLPKDYYISQYEDHSFKYIADFEEDHDLNTASVKGCSIEADGLSKWTERILPLRNDEELGQDNTGVFLGWDRNDNKMAGPYYAINLSDSTASRVFSDSLKNLCLFIANNSDSVNSVNFSIQIKTHTTTVTRNFNDFYRLPPLLKTELAKWNIFKDVKKDMPIERVLQYVQIPLSLFSNSKKTIKPKDIQQVKFIFDKQLRGSIILDKIGFN